MSHAARQQQSLPGLHLPAANGRPANDSSDLWSDMRSRKSDAKSPRSSQGRSSVSRKVRKSKRKKEAEERGEEYEVILPIIPISFRSCCRLENLSPS